MRVVAILSLVPFLHAAALRAGDEPLTIGRALAVARDRAPLLAAERVRVALAGAELERARYLAVEEPELGFGLARRVEPDGRAGWDRRIEVSQRFEMGGQRSRRIRRARSSLEATTGEVAAFERDYLAAVAGAYLEAAAARERRDLLDRCRALAGETYEAARARSEAGASPLLERALAEIELGRARAHRWEAEAERIEASARLGYLLGLEPGPEMGTTGLEEAVGELLRALGPASRPTDDRLAERAEVVAARARIEAQEADLAAARRERVPDLVISAGRGREEEHGMTMLGASLAVPILRRNRAEIRASALEIDRLRARLAEATRAAERDAVVAAGRLDAAEAALVAMKAMVGERSEEALSLAVECYNDGKIGLLELIRARRSTVEALEHLLDKRLGRGLALVEFARISGRLPAKGEPAPEPGER